MILFIAVGLWFGMQRFGISIPGIGSVPSSIENPLDDFEPLDALLSSTKNANEPNVPINKSVFVKPIKPNKLNQPEVALPQTVEVAPNDQGDYSIQGYLGRDPVIWAIKVNSAITAASSEMAPRTCTPRQFTMNGQVVSGCIGTVSEILIGSLELNNVQVFFTDQLTGTHAVLGSNATKRLFLSRTANNIVLRAN